MEEGERKEHSNAIWKTGICLKKYVHVLIPIILYGEYLEEISLGLGFVERTQ